MRICAFLESNQLMFIGWIRKAERGRAKKGHLKISWTKTQKMTLWKSSGRSVTSTEAQEPGEISYSERGGKLVSHPIIVQ